MARLRKSRPQRSRKWECYDHTVGEYVRTTRRAVRKETTASERWNKRWKRGEIEPPY